MGLSWDERADEAPAVEIKGDNAMAERIVQTARRFGVPVVEDPSLARSLRPLEPGQGIPARLFEAVAAVLNSIERRLPRK